MLISKRTRYALHGLGYIASQPRGKIVAFPEILAYLRGYADELTLSEGYIAKIFQSLSRAGIVRTEAGRSGGYLLAEDPREMPLVRVVEAIDGPTFDGCCLLAVGECHAQESCGVYDVVRGAESAFLQFLRKETLATLSRKMALPGGKPAASKARAASARRGSAKARGAGARGGARPHAGPKTRGGAKVRGGAGSRSGGSPRARTRRPATAKGRRKATPGSRSARRG